MSFKMFITAFVVCGTSGAVGAPSPSVSPYAHSILHCEAKNQQALMTEFDVLVTLHTASLRREYLHGNRSQAVDEKDEFFGKASVVATVLGRKVLFETSLHPQSNTGKLKFPYSQGRFEDGERKIEISFPTQLDENGKADGVRVSYTTRHSSIELNDWSCHAYF